VSRTTDPIDYKSDLYVFAFQHERDPERWNALDLTQWEFYVFPVDQLRQFATRRVRLVTLRECQGRSFKAAEFIEVTQKMIADIVRTRPISTSTTASAVSADSP
jgi:hypothetical protein